MTDLVIGARRPSASRPLRALLLAVLLCALLGLVAFFVFRRVVAYPTPGGDVPRGPLEFLAGDDGARVNLSASSLRYAGSLPVLRLVGDPHTLGAARGRLLGDRLAPSAAALYATMAHAHEKVGVFSDLLRPARLSWRYRVLDDGLPGYQLLELAGLSRGGVGLDYAELLRGQAALDVGTPARESAGAAFGVVSRSLSFAAQLRTAAGDRLILGRSFGLPGAGDHASLGPPLITFGHAEEVIPFASVGWPDLIGVVSGVNAEGIAVMVHPATADDVTLSGGGQPVALIARDLLENARSLDDAIGLLEHARPLGAAVFLVASGHERRFAVVERSPGRKAIHREPPIPVVTQLFSGKPFAEDAENDRARRTGPEAMRQARVAELLRAGSLDSPGRAAEILRDRRGLGGQGLPLGHRGAAEDLAAIHAAVFDLSAMVLWVSEGPGASGRFRAFDLRFELRGEGQRPAPPPDIPPADDLDPAEANAVLVARRLLARARLARAQGERARARELIVRALARAPELPEALLLAGHHAHEDDDKDAAAHFYRRYLGSSPEEPGAADHVRARLEND